MSKLLLCCGIAASGKSTYAKQLAPEGWVEINRDTFRFNLFCDGKHDWSLYKFSKQRENEVTDHCTSSWEMAKYLGDNVVVSDTNLNPKYHTLWKERAEAVGYEFEVKYFDITLEEAIKRDSKRGALQVGREVLFKQWQDWLEITKYKRYTPNEHKPKALWVDIDGTVALPTHRGHHDYDKVITDTPRLDVISMLQSWADRDNLQFIFMSGRPESCREDTTKWLLQYFDDVPYLYMRATGDFRSDRIVKEELFWEHLAPNWNIVAAVDDRPKITRLEVDLGIPLVINVSKTYNEF